MEAATAFVLEKALNYGFYVGFFREKRCCSFHILAKNIYFYETLKTLLFLIYNC